MKFTYITLDSLRSRSMIWYDMVCTQVCEFGSSINFQFYSYVWNIWCHRLHCKTCSVYQSCLYCMSATLTFYMVKCLPQLRHEIPLAFGLLTLIRHSSTACRYNGGRVSPVSRPRSFCMAAMPELLRSCGKAAVMPGNGKLMQFSFGAVY